VLSRWHQDILRKVGKCQVYDPVPLVLVKDILKNIPQIKNILSSLLNSEPQAKRARVN